MKITRRQLRSLIKESIEYDVQGLIDALSSLFEVSIFKKDNMGTALEITKRYPPISTGAKCKVYMFVIVRSDGSVNLAEIGTFSGESFGKNQINYDCYGNDFAKQSISDFLSVIDQFDIEVDLTASSDDEERFPNSKLVDFYSRYGFDQYSTKGNGYVEMFRDRVSDRV
jgi:hypothetical protein